MASTGNVEKPDKEGKTTLFQGKNIHSSPVDGKLLCSFSEKTCMQRRLNRYAFCIRHVLEDKNSPFKQCKFVAKYNGQRCTNAIPVKEERIYCNSHLQVLGIVPKKSRKKKVHVDQNSAKRVSKTPQTDIISRTSQNTISKRTEKATSSVVTPKPSPDERSVRKAKVISANPLLCQLVNTYSQASSSKRDLFHYYGLYSSDEESECEEESEDCCRKGTTTTKIRKPDSCDNLGYNKHSPRAAKLWELRKSLHTELLGIKRSISAYNKDVKQSTKALGLLMTSVKASPSLTAVAIQNDNHTFLTGSRKRSAPPISVPILCAAKEKVKCERTAIPYTKYCARHIINDSKQLLFHQCSAELSPNVKCLVPTLDLLHDLPLCREHASNNQATYRPIPTSVQPKLQDVPVAVEPQKPPAKKARRKPQARAVPTQKPAKPSKKATKKETQRTPKSEKYKKVVNVASYPVNPKKPDSNHLKFEKPTNRFILSNVVSEPHHIVNYIQNGSLKMERLCRKNDLSMFENNEFKEPHMFDAHDMDGSLENEDLNIPEDLGDISPTGMLRDTVLKLPLELSESRDNSPLKQPCKSPIDSFSMNSVCGENLHKPMMSSSSVELPRKTNLVTNRKQYDVPIRVSHMNVLPGVRPSRTSVITLPKYPSNPSYLGQSLQRHGMPVSSLPYTSFTPISPNIIKTEGGMRKPEHRPIDLNHGPPLYPLQFDTVLNSAVAWGSNNGKLVINHRARPLLVNTPTNRVFSPSALSPHISPQIALGTAFNFDRPSVLQHSNSSSPTLSPFSASLPNSPHGKLLPRTIRLESRTSTNPNDMDPFFGASFDKP